MILSATIICPRSTGAMATMKCQALGLLAVLFCLWTGTAPSVAAEISIPKESQLKAAFVINFVKFVEWPTNRFQGSNSPFFIGVAGPSAVGTALEAAVKGRKINGRELIFKNLATPEAVQGVHLVFVGAAADSRLDSLLKAAASAGAVTVGESEPFARQGGMIRFVVDDDKLRFEINMESADAAGLKVSAQMQKLAKPVQRKP